ncbi:MAG TPA: hypothetical protein VF169_10990 [Albitalea sp.]|uniref:hypothetical protein n=1 Tax=Piscinibacter sp. TaxID=1903157 RepID=UPI002ED2008B
MNPLNPNSPPSTCGSTSSADHQQSPLPARFGHARAQLSVASIKDLLSSRRLPWSWSRKPAQGITPAEGKTFELVHAEHALTRYLQRVIERLDMRREPHPNFYWTRRDVGGPDSLVLRPNPPVSKRVLNHLLFRGVVGESYSVRELLEARHRSGQGDDAGYSIGGDLIPCLKELGQVSATSFEELDALTPRPKGTSAAEAPLDTWPNEIVLDVLELLPARTLKDLLLTSRRLHRLTQTILKGQSEQAQEFRRNARQSVSLKIDALARASSPNEFGKGLPELIRDSKHIGVALTDSPYIGSGVADHHYIDILLKALAHRSDLCSFSMDDESTFNVATLINFLRSVVTRNPDLSELMVRVNRCLADQGVLAVANIPRLTKVNLHLDKSCPVGIRALLSKPTLRHVELTVHRNSDGRAEGDAIARSSSLTTLGLDWVTDAALQGMAPGLGASCALRSLRISGEFELTGMQALRAALEQTTSIAHVSICPSVVHDGLLAALAPMLSTNKSIRSLRLEMSESGLRGAEALARAMKTNNTLVDLECQFSMGAESAKWVARMLGDNRSIEKIDLSKCKLTDAAAKQLALGLMRNTTLKEVGIRTAGVTSPGLKALAQALRAMPALTTVNLRSYNGSGLKTLSKLLSGTALDVTCSI